jgi:hypothetical protein
MKLFNSKSLNEMGRDELIDIILDTGTQKYLKGDINEASIEELKKIASITHVGEKGMKGMAKFFFYFGLILFIMFIISLIRAHWTQAIIELIIVVLVFATSSFSHVRKGIKSIKK